MRQLILKAVKLIGCFLFLVPLQAVATTVVMLHTDFVPQSKVERLKQYAANQQVELVSITPAQFNPVQLEGVDFLFADTPRMPDRQRLTDAIADIPPKLEWVMLGGGPPTASDQLDPQLHRMLMGYFLNGTVNNYNAFFQAIDRKVKGLALSELPRPEQVPSYGIYLNEEAIVGVNAYLSAVSHCDDKPIVGFVTARNQIINQEFEPLEHLMQMAQEANVTPVIYYLDDEYGLDWPWQDIRPSILVNMTHLQQGEKRKSELEALNVPMVQTIHYREGNIEHWRESDVGIEQRSASVTLATTETWGLTDPLIISADIDDEKVFISEQMDLLFGRAHSYHRLATKAVEDKSLAVMFWNAPAGAENISASNLNVPRSIANIANGLRNEGFAIPEIEELDMIADAKELLSGYYQPETLQSLYEEGYAAALPLRDYLRWYRSVPTDTRHFVNGWWGHPMRYEGLLQIDGEPAFVFPILKRGNLWLLPQPPRSGKVGDAIHAVKEPPNHLFLAVYLWLQMKHKNNDLDALVHLGTHGSQEWTPGKARGLAREDFPYLTLGDVPVYYPYIQDNIAEAIQAKRRGRATIISHQTPTFGPAGLYGEYVELNALLGDYQSALPGSVKDELQLSLIGKIKELNVLADMGLEVAALENDFDGVLYQLEEHIDRLAASSVPLGLHVFGQAKSGQDVIYTIMQQQGDALIGHFVEKALEFLEAV